MNYFYVFQEVKVENKPIFSLMRFPKEEEHEVKSVDSDHSSFRISVKHDDDDEEGYYNSISFANLD